MVVCETWIDNIFARRTIQYTKKRTILKYYAIQMVPCLQFTKWLKSSAVNRIFAQGFKVAIFFAYKKKFDKSSFLTSKLKFNLNSYHIQNLLHPQQKLLLVFSQLYVLPSFFATLLGSISIWGKYDRAFKIIIIRKIRK